MKSIMYEDFAAHLPEVVSTVTDLGDMVRVINKNGENFVIMEEAECNFLLEAARKELGASKADCLDELIIFNKEE